MAQTLAEQVRALPGYEAWAADQRVIEAAAEVDDLTVLARIVGVFVDPFERAELVGAIRAAGFRRTH